MVVRTQTDGRGSFGLRVGALNARRHFPRTVESVELQLDDLRIECHLPDSFWDGQPEIHDPRLCAWLKFKIHRNRKSHERAAFDMVQSGTNSFTLISVPPVRRKMEMNSAA